MAAPEKIDFGKQESGVKISSKEVTIDSGLGCNDRTIQYDIHTTSTKGYLLLDIIDVVFDSTDKVQCGEHLSEGNSTEVYTI